MDFNFEKSEITYLILALLSMGALAFITNYVPAYNVISEWNPIWQFLLLNVGLYCVYFVLFKFLVGEDDAPSWQGALGNYLIFFAMDILMPEYHVTTGGLIAGGIFGKSASDYFVGYVLTFLGASGWWLWILTYPIMFTVLFVVGALVFKDFVSQL